MLFPGIDSRIAKWPLMESATPLNIIVLFYLLFVKVLGPAYMKNRQPYDLKILRILYSFGLVVHSFWVFRKLGKHGWFGKYDFVCAPINYNTDEDAMTVVTACWHFYISTIIVLLDTVFLVLRKKDSQVTFLHLFHHSLLPLITRFVLIRGAAGFNTMSCFSYSFVHFFVHMSNGFEAIGPSWQKYVWQERTITMLQILQFQGICLGMLTHVIVPGCEVNAPLLAVNAGQGIVFFVLYVALYETYSFESPIVTMNNSHLENTGLPPQENLNDSNGKHRSRIGKHMESRKDSET